MKSARPSVLHPLAGRSVIEHVLRAADPLGAASTTLVVGPAADDARAALAARPGLTFVTQSPPRGTVDALLQVEPMLAGKSGILLALRANAPLVEPATLTRLIDRHRSTQAAATIVTATRDAGGTIEHGSVCFDLSPLFGALRAIPVGSGQAERSLADLLAAYRNENRRVETLVVDSADEIRGVTTLADLADLTAIVRARKNRALMLAGVTLEDPATTYIDVDVSVGADTVIGPGVLLQGRTTIGGRCRIHAGCRLTDATLADAVTVLDRTIIVDSRVAAGAQVGPFAHVRPGSDLAEGARVGNFVELKKTRLGRRSKANHLTYLGDATIGDDVNVGAGTITCNYDGERKHPTVVEDGVFIGSDSQLIAPITIGKGAYVGAGSSITHDVPPDALAVARGRQVTKPGWAAHRRARKKTEHS